MNTYTRTHRESTQTKKIRCSHRESAGFMASHDGSRWLAWRGAVVVVVMAMAVERLYLLVGFARCTRSAGLSRART